MNDGLSETQRATIRTLCDTVFPSLTVEGKDDPTGFWVRKASDLHVPLAVETYLWESVSAYQRLGLLFLIDALADKGFGEAAQERREELLREVSGWSEAAAIGIGSLVRLILLLVYGLPDQHGHNPNWAALGFPGPIAAPSHAPKPIHPLVPDEEQATLEADVCVVGSGSGGGVIAGILAAQGRRVVVLEAGGYYNEADFNGLELWGYQHLYYRGGPVPTADNNVSLLAGATLGGGSTVNWTNCLRTKPWVREQWAREFGLEGLDTPDYDRHLDAVLQRISANADCSDPNGPHRRMREGCERLGYAVKRIVRNADPSTYEFRSAGYMGFGDASGSKQGTLKTYLQDAYDHGARIVVNCRAERILVEDGRAAGVEATYRDPAGRTVAVTVRAPRVVAACGALESPRLLLRSGIGGPAVGRYLRLHPTVAVSGVYDEQQHAYWGAPQTALCDEFDNTGHGTGFLIEGVQYGPGLLGSAAPWTGGRAHKELMEQMPYTSSLIAVTSDHGHGSVTLGPDGEAVHAYEVADPIDADNLRLGLETLIRIHEAAGAHTILSLDTRALTWRRGDDLEDFIRRVREVSLRAGGMTLFSAHQMGTCRMGTDLATSVADPRGELHDVKGVWIGDASAFPTSSGTNPMVTVMALAHRTAGMISASMLEGVKVAGAVL